MHVNRSTYGLHWRSCCTGRPQTTCTLARGTRWLVVGRNCRHLAQRRTRARTRRWDALLAAEKGTEGKSLAGKTLPPSMLGTRTPCVCMWSTDLVSQHADMLHRKMPGNSTTADSSASALRLGAYGSSLIEPSQDCRWSRTQELPCSAGTCPRRRSPRRTAGERGETGKQHRVFLDRARGTAGTTHCRTDTYCHD